MGTIQFSQIVTPFLIDNKEIHRFVFLWAEHHFSINLKILPEGN